VGSSTLILSARLFRLGVVGLFGLFGPVALCEFDSIFIIFNKYFKQLMAVVLLQTGTTKRNIKAL
jgi:hypothetical protein